MATSTGVQLPTWEMLSAEQETIVNLSTERDYVIQGAPGTGKSVLALYRAARIAQRDNCDITILVYNRPLMLYLQAAIEGNPYFEKVRISTYHSWLFELYRTMFRTSVPKVGAYEFAWDKILKDSAIIANCKTHIIIDEAQDFPVELIRVLKNVARNITCFIDPNQAIEPDKLGINEVLKNLCIEYPRSLMKNYRNTREIAELSKQYWNGEGCLAEADETRVGISKPKMIKCKGYDTEVSNIISIIRANKEKTIGIFVNSKELNVMNQKLSAALAGEVEVEVFRPSEKNSLDFHKGGVKILSFGTMKGLEFDVVIIGRYEKIRSTGNPIADINRAYVAVTRACKELYICYFGTACTEGWADIMKQILSKQELCEWE